MNWNVTIQSGCKESTFKEVLIFDRHSLTNEFIARSVQRDAFYVAIRSDDTAVITKGVKLTW